MARTGNVRTAGGTTVRDKNGSCSDGTTGAVTLRPAPTHEHRPTPHARRIPPRGPVPANRAGTRRISRRPHSSANGCRRLLRARDPRHTEVSAAEDEDHKENHGTAPIFRRRDGTSALTTPSDRTARRCSAPLRRGLPSRRVTPAASPARRHVSDGRESGTHPRPMETGGPKPFKLPVSSACDVPVRTVRPRCRSARRAPAHTRDSRP